MTSPSSTGSAPLDEAGIWELLKLSGKRQTAAEVREILAKAAAAQGLTAAEVAVLTGISDPELLAELFDTARRVKDRIYGRRLVLFAPLYISNLCNNDCLYCAFRSGNRDVKRRALAPAEIEHETEALLRQGHKRVLLVAGESYPSRGFEYVLEAVRAVYAARSGRDSIRRVNVNVAPLSTDDFRALKAEKIGTYQLFQETYHRETYARVHRSGPKRDYDWRVTAMDRALEAGIDDVGIGVLFGLADWRFEILAILAHIARLEARWGLGPHTISVPRLEPATGSSIAEHPPHPVADVDFRKLVAILRVAVPYTGLIMSTRETPNLRRETFALGVSQISAGSRTQPGGYAAAGASEAQFSLGDHRSLDEVVRDVAGLGYIPSFCTACYRAGRTGERFMALAKPGRIHEFCRSNALLTFAEYLLDYASSETRAIGERLIAEQVGALAGFEGRAELTERLARIRAGERDLFF